MFQKGYAFVAIYNEEVGLVRRVRQVGQVRW